MTFSAEDIFTRHAVQLITGVSPRLSNNPRALGFPDITQHTRNTVHALARHSETMHVNTADDDDGEDDDDDNDDDDGVGGSGRRRRRHHHFFLFACLFVLFFVFF